MKRYVLFVGGGGARAAEALLVASCAGVLRADALQVLLADTDDRGLRSARMLQAKYADYDCMQVPLDENAQEDSLQPFHTKMNFTAWPEEIPGGATTLAGWTADAEEDALLCQALFAKDAAQMDLRGGFQGRREVGQTVFAGLLHFSEQGGQDALARRIAEMNAALDKGEEVRVVLCGSVTGGTGAAGLPLMARHVSRLTAGRARIGAVLLAATGDYEDAAKAQQVIADFAGETACSAVCLLGLPCSSHTAVPPDCAHLTDWLAVYCMDVLLHRPTWPQGLFTVQTEAGPLSWGIFGKAAGRYRLAYGRLMKAAAAWNHVIAPAVVRRLQHPFFLRDNLFGWYAHFFRKAGWRRETCLDDVDRLTRLMQVVLIWMGGLMHSLPPEMTHGEAFARARGEAQEHYQALVELAGQLTMLDDEAQLAEVYEEGRVYRRQEEEAESESVLTGRRIDAVRQEMERRRVEQARCSQRIGGAASIRLLQEALADVEEASAELKARYLEANRRIDHAESIAAEEDLYRITDARTKLERMVRHQRMLDAREAFILEDVALAQEDAARFSKPELQGAGEGNGLFHPRMTRRLMAQDRHIRAGEVEKAYPELVQPADGRTLRETRKRICRAHVEQEAPVMSLLYALMNEAMEEA